MQRIRFPRAEKWRSLGVVALAIAVSGCVTALASPAQQRLETVTSTMQDEEQSDDMTQDDEEAHWSSRATTESPVPIKGVGGHLNFKQRIVGEGLKAGEQTIAFAPDGSAFVPAATTTPPEVPTQWDVYRTTDMGLKWEPTGWRTRPDFQSINQHSPADGYLTQDPTTGTVYFAYLTVSVTCRHVDAFQDKWTQPTPDCIPVHDHETVFVGKARPGTGASSTLYACANDAITLHCASSSDGGRTFGPRIPVGAQADQCGASGSGHGAASWSDGSVYVPLGQCGGAFVHVSHDFGLTWKLVAIDTVHGVTPDPADSHEVTVAVDAEGTVYAAWIDQSLRMRFSVSRDAGESWSPSVVVTAPHVTWARYPALAVGDPGKVVAFYVGTSIPGFPKYQTVEDLVLQQTPANRPMELAEGEANATWNGYVAYLPTGLDPEPLVLTSLTHAPDDPLARGSCRFRCGPGFDGGATGRQHAMWDYQDIQINPYDGRVWASYNDLCTGACSRSESMERVSLAAVGVQLGGDPILTIAGRRP